MRVGVKHAVIDEETDELAAQTEARVRDEDTAERLQQLPVYDDAGARGACGKADHDVQHPEMEGVDAPE